jgi:multicomponent Na+:H+ antiporter subunit G
MTLVLNVISSALLATGAIFVISGGVGLLRFPDFYTRIHAAGIADTAGAGLILLGLLLQAPDWSVAVRLLIILLFIVLSGATATHTLAQAARRDGVHVWEAGNRRR